MAKEFKTRGELQKLVLDEARNSGKCADVPDIVITGPFPSRELTWDIRKQPGSVAVSVDCTSEIDKIVRVLSLAAYSRTGRQVPCYGHAGHLPAQPLRDGKHGAFDPESRSVEFYAAEFNDLGHFGGFLSNEFSEIGRGAGERRKANIREPRLDFSIGKSSVSIAKDNLPRFSATAARANGSFPYGT